MPRYPGIGSSAILRNAGGVYEPSLRLGFISSIDHVSHTCSVTWIDMGGVREEVPVIFPYIGRGWGILPGVEVGTMVVVATGLYGAPYIVGYLPINAFTNWDFFKFEEGKDLREREGVNIWEHVYRTPRSGELILQSKKDSIIHLTDLGDIVLETVEGNKWEINAEQDAIIGRSVQFDVGNEAGHLIMGLIKRATKEVMDEAKQSSTSDFQRGVGLRQRVIGFDPSKLYHPKDNKALTELNLMLAEFADSNVGKYYTGDSKKEREKNKLIELIVGTVTGGDIKEDYWDSKTKSYKTPPDESGRFIDRFGNITDKPQLAGALKFVLFPRKKEGEGEYIPDREKKRPEGLPFETIINKEGTVSIHVPASTKEDIPLEEKTTKYTPTEYSDAEGVFKGEGELPKGKGRSVDWRTDGSIRAWVGKEEQTSDDGQRAYNGRSVDFLLDGGLRLEIGKEVHTEGPDLSSDRFVFPRTDGKDLNDRSLDLATKGGIKLIVEKETHTGSPGLEKINDISTDVKTSGWIKLDVGKKTDAVDKGKSIDLKTSGSIYSEEIGADVDSNSVYIKKTTGKIFLKQVGKDTNGKSLEVTSDGGWKIIVNGADTTTGKSIDISANGAVRISVDGNVDIESTGDINVKSTMGNITVDSEMGDLYLNPTS